MRANRLRCSIYALALLATACTESLDSPTIVRTPRILAIVAEPPEAAPGEDLLVDAMISIPEDVARPLSLRWLSCIDAEEVLRASGFREIELPGSPECDEQMLPEGEPYVVRGERTEELVETLRDLAMLGGFDVMLFETLLATTGLAYFVDVQVLDANGEVVVAGFKRVAMTTREMPTTNPPPPTFLFGQTMITATGEPFDFTCGAADGVVPTVAPGAEVELVPVLPEGADEEPWLETFPIFDFTGGLTTARENAYYTWLATAGHISEFTTRPPERASEWTAPDEEGLQTLWLVVRDGHLGGSACRLDVVVAR
ncbi:hypothetical protein [Sandaracinus amylolyticus]|uniref:hypothetical protein n=1 Tax=Sandaracinus amylolyticus TaxID=927083 RepID=UPI001F3F78DD|nr:hypothetical protein [Sandaracinus amylolyticus]UJR86640.1 Hypothetical protein I5071_87410 [Sandaracinus amylolyticus]